LEGSSDFQGEGARENDSGYSVGLGISLRFIDPELLSLAKKRAEEKIAKYNAKILGRERELTNLIEREHANALNLRKQADELRVGVESRRSVFVQKRSGYENGKENIQSVIMARKNLFDSQVSRGDVLGDFFEIIVELDQCSGVYFRKLGLSINMEDK
jgi:outer membrane protein TolC